MMPPGPRTTSQELAAVVPTVPAAPAPNVTSAEELARREEAAERKALRSRIAEIVALTLDGASENGAAPAGGIPVAAAPASTRASALAIAATPEELALGKTKFDGMCTVCHGQDGKGGTPVGAPALTGRTDLANIKRTVEQGQGEMPALGNALSPAEIDAIGKYVVKTLGPPQRALNTQGRPVREEEEN